MLQIFKQLFSEKSQKSQECESIPPRNRFADLDFERVLKSGTRCCADEGKHYAKDDKITLFEFSIDFAKFEFMGDFKIEGEDQFRQLSARLNSIDSAIQSHLESEIQRLIPQFAKNLGYTQKRWEKTFYFHPRILSFDENPPNLRYVANYVNDGFTVFFAKKHGRWKVYWDEKCQNVIKEQLGRTFIEIQKQRREQTTKKLDTQSPDFQAGLKALLAFETAQNLGIDRIVANICADVQKHGDAALIEYTSRFDGTSAQTIDDLILTRDDLQSVFERLPENIQTALKTVARRVESYHKHQEMESWTYEDEDDTLLSQQITLLDRVGIYIPGGEAVYPSSVIMNAMPAHVVDVKEIIMVVLTPKGEYNNIVLMATFVAGITKVFTAGGTQVVAALAYDTESVPQVDKITGPDNTFVAAAKRRVFGVVGIDMVAGPSEILMIADGTTPADWVAMDLFSQVKHDEITQAILIGASQTYLGEVQTAMNHLAGTMPHRAIVEASLGNRDAIILAKDLDKAYEIANHVSPEHLELSVENPQEWTKKIRHADAILMGRYASESLDDYCADPNHVLPISHTARFSSPLGAYDFQKRSNLIQVSEQGTQKLGKTASMLAHSESLTVHARAAEFCLKNNP